MTRTATFTVSMTQAHLVEATVAYATVNDSAVAGRDYTHVTGTLVFTVGQTTKTVSVPIQAVSDRQLTFRLKLSLPSNVTLLPPDSGAAMIQPDNALLALIAIARQKRTDAETALAARNAADAAKSDALTARNAANAAYDAAIAEKTAAQQNLSSANASLVSANNALAASIATGNMGLVAIAQAGYNNAVNAVNNANARLAAADANITTTTQVKTEKQAAYDASVSAHSTSITAYTNALAAAETARATAAAGFVGSTNLVL